MKKGICECCGKTERSLHKDSIRRGWDALDPQKGHLCGGRGQPLENSCLPQLQSTSSLSVWFTAPFSWLPTAAHSLDQELHLGLSSKPVSCYLPALTLTGEFGK